MMAKATRSRWLPYPIEQVYNTLTDTNALENIVKRIDKIKLIERTGDVGAVEVILDLPAKKFMETSGQVIGVPMEQLTFRTNEPLPLQFTWVLASMEIDGKQGTEVTSTLEIDISFFVAVFSNILLQGILAGELDADLERLENWIASHA